MIIHPIALLPEDVYKLRQKKKKKNSIQITNVTANCWQPVCHPRLEVGFKIEKKKLEMLSFVRAGYVQKVLKFQDFCYYIESPSKCDLQETGYVQQLFKFSDIVCKTIRIACSGIVYLINQDIVDFNRSFARFDRNMSFPRA